MQTTREPLKSTRLGRDLSSYYGLWISLVVHVAIGVALAMIAPVSHIAAQKTEYVEVAQFHFEAPLIAQPPASEGDATSEGPSASPAPRKRPAPAPSPPPEAPIPKAAPASIPPPQPAQPTAPQEAQSPDSPPRDVADRIDPNAPPSTGGATSASSSGDRTDGDGVGAATSGAGRAPSEGAQVGAVGSRELWTEYGAVLQRSCEKFKFYPHAALVRGWQGTAEVQIDRSADGVVSLSIRRSAGRKVLDDAALEIVRQGMAELPIPEKFRNRALVLHIFIRFRIAD